MSLNMYKTTAGAGHSTSILGKLSSKMPLSPLQTQQQASPPQAARRPNKPSPPPQIHSPHYYMDGHVNNNNKSWNHFYVLPVLLLEFLALALTRAVLPSLLLKQFDSSVYLVMGCTECVRGFLAFVSCPMFGKLSDVVGRKLCLLVTVAGTCAPVCSLALLQWESPSETTPTTTSLSNEDRIQNMTSVINVTSSSDAVWSASMGSSSTPQEQLHPHALGIFVVLLALSGIFSSTFTLVFAYISDTVKERDERVSAYGLALATLGLSFTIGPIAGGYLSQYNTRLVFWSSLVLTILDLLYIYFVLPESRELPSTFNRNNNRETSSLGTPSSLDTLKVVSWNPWDTMRVIALDPFLRLVGQVTFLYYTALWAVISTLVLYAAKRFDLGPTRLGELMSALGLSTMVAEAVLVRILVPILGEKKSMKVGLAAFGMQCVVLGFAYEGWHLFVCIVFSMIGNLVYPSLTSLVSGSIEPEALGEALGAVNGVKALTEGIGPLVFGTLMTLSENSVLPGWPYLLAAAIVYLAYRYANDLPDVEEDDYVHELERKKRRLQATRMADSFATKRVEPRSLNYFHYDDDDDEVEGLLECQDSTISEIDTDADESAEVGESDTSRLPLTFAGFQFR